MGYRERGRVGGWVKKREGKGERREGGREREEGRSRKESKAR